MPDWEYVDGEWVGPSTPPTGSMVIDRYSTKDIATPAVVLNHLPHRANEYLIPFTDATVAEFNRPKFENDPVIEIQFMGKFLQDGKKIYAYPARRLKHITDIDDLIKENYPPALHEKARDKIEKFAKKINKELG